MASHGSVLNTFSDFLIYDERKGRILHSRYLNTAQHYEVWRFQFNRLRPDLPDSMTACNTYLLKLARSIIGQLRTEQFTRHKSHAIMLRSEFADPRNIELYERTLDFMSPHFGGIVTTKVYGWQDQLKTADYAKQVIQKVHRYGMFNASGSYATKEQKMQFEEKLYQFFCKKLGVEST